MIQITYSDGGCLLTLFKTFGIGIAMVNTDDEKSVTFTLKVAQAHTFFTLAWI